MPAETVFVEEGKHPMGRFARAEGLPDGGSMFDGGPHFPQVCAHLFCAPRRPRAQSPSHPAHPQVLREGRLLDVSSAQTLLQLRASSLEVLSADGGSPPSKLPA